jgi:hypothetical protein
MRRFLVVALAMMTLAVPPAGQTQQTYDTEEVKNTKQARAALDAMVQALGGDAWLNMKNQMREGHIAAFYHGNPNLGTTKFYEFHEWPDHDRIEFTPHRDVMQFYIGRAGWELTYRGKKALPQDQVEEFLRRRDHSVETAVKVWLKDPKTILIYEGQRLAERHLAEQVTLISAQNDSITIQMDKQTHLPLRRSYQFRDPVYKDKNLEAEEYADYHVIDGLPTAFSITRLRNNEMVRQVYIDKVSYNQPLAPDFWDADAAAAKIKK